MIVANMIDAVISARLAALLRSPVNTRETPPPIAVATAFRPPYRFNRSNDSRTGAAWRGQSIGATCESGATS
jgi:hypothetical protein